MTRDKRSSENVKSVIVRGKKLCSASWCLNIYLFFLMVTPGLLCPHAHKYGQRIGPVVKKTSRRLALECFPFFVILDFILFS